MQSTGQTSTHAVSLVPTHGSQMMNANPFIILAIAATLKASPYAWIIGSPAAWIDAATVKTSPATCVPALTALFTPARPVLGHYEVCTTEHPHETLERGRTARVAARDVRRQRRARADAAVRADCAGAGTGDDRRRRRRLVRMRANDRSCVRRRRRLFQLHRLRTLGASHAA